MSAPHADVPDADAPDLLTDRIDAVLPQTQCTQCGFGGCRPYARAIAHEGAPINRCPPGGQRGIDRLASLLQRQPLALDPSCGAEGPRRIARIDESLCIGCTKCIVACPVDAIIGARKRMHAVIADLCSGCALCLPPCPVDCIVLEPSPAHPAWTDDDALAARRRHEARRLRLERDRRDDEQRLQRMAKDKLERLADEPQDDHTRRKRAVIEAAMRRARERLSGDIRR